MLWGLQATIRFGGKWFESATKSIVATRQRLTDEITPLDAFGQFGHTGEFEMNNSPPQISARRRMAAAMRDERPHRQYIEATSKSVHAEPRRGYLIPKNS